MLPRWYWLLPDMRSWSLLGAQRAHRRDRGGTARGNDGGKKRAACERSGGSREGHGVPERYTIQLLRHESCGAYGERQAHKDPDRHAFERSTQHQLYDLNAVRAERHTDAD